MYFRSVHEFLLISQEFALTNSGFSTRNWALLVKSSCSTTECNDVLLAESSFIPQSPSTNSGAIQFLAIPFEGKFLIGLFDPVAYLWRSWR